jgi:hypothetical protein
LRCSLNDEQCESSVKLPGQTSNYDLKMFLRADAKLADCNLHSF